MPSDNLTYWINPIYRECLLRRAGWLWSVRVVHSENQFEHKHWQKRQKANHIAACLVFSISSVLSTFTLFEAYFVEYGRCATQSMEVTILNDTAKRMYNFSSLKREPWQNSKYISNQLGISCTRWLASPTIVCRLAADGKLRKGCHSCGLLLINRATRMHCSL